MRSLKVCCMLGHDSIWMCSGRAGAYHRYLKTYGYYRFHPDFLYSEPIPRKLIVPTIYIFSIKRATPPEALFLIA